MIATNLKACLLCLLVGLSAVHSKAAPRHSKKLKHPIREATVLHGGSGKFAIRQGEWVLIDAPTGDGNGGRNRPGEPAWFKQERGYTKSEFPGELYNLQDDLSQRRNLYGEMPDVVRHLKALLEKHKAAGRSTPGPALKSSPVSQ